MHIDAITAVTFHKQKVIYCRIIPLQRTDFTLVPPPLALHSVRVLDCSDAEVFKTPQIKDKATAMSLKQKDNTKTNVYK
jgi:hypothetical protein